jgi:hypothetical protein
MSKVEIWTIVICGLSCVGVGMAKTQKEFWSQVLTAAAYVPLFGRIFGWW